MTAKPRIKTITVNDGTVVPIEPDGVTAFVGPNNAGKSALLREIEPLKVGTSHKIVTHIDFALNSTDMAGLTEWLDSRFAITGSGPAAAYANDGHEVSRDNAPLWLGQGNYTGGRAHTLITRRLDGSDRLTLTDSVPTFDAISGAPQNPLQRVFADTELEHRLSQAATRAFMTGISISRVSSDRIRLYVGEPVQQIGDVATHLEEFRQRQLVEEQGDGFRSYVGILMATLAVSHPILLVDEPEAFLHPPQARMLGRELAEFASLGRQVIVATHSDDFVNGLLDHREGSVTIVRLTRELAGTNRTRILDASSLNRLWSNPILRYSKVISGLFHRGAIICEADGDCLFYEAAISDGRQTDGEFQFLHCGGKARMTVLVDALRSIGVPTVTIPDIDVLREENIIERLVRSHGGDWSTFRPDWQRLRSAVESLAVSESVSDVCSKVMKVLDEHRGSSSAEQLRRDLRYAAKATDCWAFVKRAGVDAIPRGEGSTAAQTLLAGLARIGIFIPPVGEVECWDKSIGGHGPAWVADALESGASFSDARLRAFLAEVGAYLRSE